MTKIEALSIIREESLEFYNWFDSENISASKVCIDSISGKWTVFTTDERINKITELTFDDESDALEEFMKRLRASNRRRKRHLR